MKKTKKRMKTEKVVLACNRCGKTPVKYWIEGQIYLCDQCIKDMNINKTRVVKSSKYL